MWDWQLLLHHEIYSYDDVYEWNTVCWAFVRQQDKHGTHDRIKIILSNFQDILISVCIIRIWCKRSGRWRDCSTLLLGNPTVRRLPPHSDAHDMQWHEGHGEDTQGIQQTNAHRDIWGIYSTLLPVCYSYSIVVLYLSQHYLCKHGGICTHCIRTQRDASRTVRSMQHSERWCSGSQRNSPAFDWMLYSVCVSYISVAHDATTLVNFSPVAQVHVRWYSLNKHLSMPLPAHTSLGSCVSSWICIVVCVYRMLEVSMKSLRKILSYWYNSTVW